MISSSSEETKQIANDFAKTLKGGEFIALSGDLGAGKTTFVAGLAKALGVSDSVKSPTFVLMRVYKTGGHPIERVAHFDFYRIQHLESFSDLCLEEYVDALDTVVVAEWAPEIVTRGAKKIIRINMKFISENEREISIERD